MFDGLSQRPEPPSGRQEEQLPSPRLATPGPVEGRHLPFLPPTSHPRYPSSVPRLVPALVLGHNLNLPRGGLSSVTLATVPHPSFSDPQSLGLK